MSGAFSNPAGKPDLLSLACAKQMRDTDQGGDPWLSSQPEPREDGHGRHLNSGTWVLLQDLPERTRHPCRAFPQLEDCVRVLTPE